MYKFQTPQTKVANSARVEALTFYPNVGTVEVVFSIGHLAEDGTTFDEHERRAEMIPRSAVTPEMDALATSVLAWVYGHLQSNDTASPSPFCQFQIAFNGVYNQHSVMFNLSTGAHSFNYGTMSNFFAEPFGNWWRIRITHPGAAGSTVRLRIHPASGTTYPTDAAAGVGAIHVYGAQIWQFVPY